MSLCAAPADAHRIEQQTHGRGAVISPTCSQSAISSKAQLDRLGG